MPKAQRPKRTASEGQEQQLPWPHRPSPGQHDTAPRGPLSLQFLQQERVQGEHPAPQHCQSLPRRPNLRSHLKGELCSLTTGDQIMTEKENGVYGNHIWILEDWVSTHSSIQVESQWFRLSAESRLWPSLTRNLVGHRYTWFGTTNNEPYQPWSQFSHSAWAGQLIHRATNCWV